MEHRRKSVGVFVILQQQNYFHDNGHGHNDTQYSMHKYLSQFIHTIYIHNQMLVASCQCHFQLAHLNIHENEERKAKKKEERKTVENHFQQINVKYKIHIMMLEVATVAIIMQLWCYLSLCSRRTDENMRKLQRTKRFHS